MCLTTVSPTLSPLGISEENPSHTPLANFEYVRDKMLIDKSPLGSNKLQQFVWASKSSEPRNDGSHAILLERTLGVLKATCPAALIRFIHDALEYLGADKIKARAKAGNIFEYVVHFPMQQLQPTAADSLDAAADPETGYIHCYATDAGKLHVGTRVYEENNDIESVVRNGRITIYHGNGSDFRSSVMVWYDSKGGPKIRVRDDETHETHDADPQATRKLLNFFEWRNDEVRDAREKYSYMHVSRRSGEEPYNYFLPRSDVLLVAAVQCPELFASLVAREFGVTLKYDCTQKKGFSWTDTHGWKELDDAALRIQIISAVQQLVARLKAILDVRLDDEGAAGVGESGTMGGTEALEMGKGATMSILMMEEACDFLQRHYGFHFPLQDCSNASSLLRNACKFQNSLRKQRCDFFNTMHTLLSYPGFECGLYREDLKSGRPMVVYKTYVQLLYGNFERVPLTPHMLQSGRRPYDAPDYTEQMKSDVLGLFVGLFGDEETALREMDKAAVLALGDPGVMYEASYRLLRGPYDEDSKQYGKRCGKGLLIALLKQVYGTAEDMGKAGCGFGGLECSVPSSFLSTALDMGKPYPELQYVNRSNALVFDEAADEEKSGAKKRLNPKSVLTFLSGNSDRPSFSFRKLYSNCEAVMSTIAAILNLSNEDTDMGVNAGIQRSLEISPFIQKGCKTAQELTERKESGEEGPFFLIPAPDDPNSLQNVWLQRVPELAAVFDDCIKQVRSNSRTRDDWHPRSRKHDDALAAFWARIRDSMGLFDPGDAHSALRTFLRGDDYGTVGILTKCTGVCALASDNALVLLDNGAGDGAKDRFDAFQTTKKCYCTIGTGGEGGAAPCFVPCNAIGKALHESNEKLYKYFVSKHNSGYCSQKLISSIQMVLELQTVQQGQVAIPGLQGKKSSNPIFGYKFH